MTCPKRRCLESGGAYDMPAMFRVLQLWLNLATVVEVNARIDAAVSTVPSHKFLYLVYQMASRMSASTSASPNESSFQVTEEK